MFYPKIQILCTVPGYKAYSRFSLGKPNNLEMEKPRMKEDRHERRKYPYMAH